MKGLKKTMPMKKQTIAPMKRKISQIPKKKLTPSMINKMKKQAPAKKLVPAKRRYA